MQITVVVAIAANNMIGCANKLLWHIKEDLQHFKSITQGGCVVMGRKTYESIGRPLPNRRNVIISRNRGYTQEGCECYTSIDDALKALADLDNIFIIGGGEIYKQTLPIADVIEITTVEKEYEGDTLFPALDMSEWQVVSTQHFMCGEKYPHPFRFERLERVK